jgi:hypothetical protein
VSAAVTLPREDGKVGLALISNSELACFRQCPREYQFRYVMRRRPRRSSEALRFGTFFHIGLEHWWKERGNAGARLGAALIAIRNRAELHPEDSDPFELVKAEELLLGYTARWGEEDYETVGVELQFTMPMINPDTGAASRTFEVGGKIDAVARKDGRLRVVEHKTTSKDISIGADYWRRISATDPQVSTYLAGARAAGHDVEDCLYDVIRKVGLRPKLATPVESRRYTKKNGLLDARQRETDETPEEFRIRVREDIAADPEKYFARGPIVRLERDEAEHAADVWQTAWMIRESKNANRFPRSPNACERFGRLCDFFDVCSGTASIDDDNRFRTASTAHEELAEV